MRSPRTRGELSGIRPDEVPKLGDSTIVRCQQGHLFSTVWVPVGSFKAVRLGWFRIQRCPVGDHLAIVTPVREADLTDEERRIAHRRRDTWVP